MVGAEEAGEEDEEADSVDGSVLDMTKAELRRKAAVTGYRRYIEWGTVSE